MYRFTIPLVLIFQFYFLSLGFSLFKIHLCLIMRKPAFVIPNKICTDQPFLTYIMITYPCNLYPLTPHFYIVKLGFTGVYNIFLFLL